MLLVVYLKNTCLTQDQKDFPSFLSKSFIISVFTFRSRIHFELILYTIEYITEVHLLVYVYAIVPTSFAGQINLSSLNCLCTWLKFNCPDMYWLISGIFFPLTYFPTFALHHFNYFSFIMNCDIVLQLCFSFSELYVLF